MIIFLYLFDILQHPWPCGIQAILIKNFRPYRFIV